MKRHHLLDQFRFRPNSSLFFVFLPYSPMLIFFRVIVASRTITDCNKSLFGDADNVEMRTFDIESSNALAELDNLTQVSLSFIVVCCSCKFGTCIY